MSWLLGHLYSQEFILLHLCQQDPCYTQQCPLSNPCPGGVSLSSDPWQASEAPTSLPPGLGAMGSQEGGSSQSMHDLMALLTPWFAICISAGISAIALRQCPLSDSQQESSPPKRHHSGTLSVEKKIWVMQKEKSPSSVRNHGLLFLSSRSKVAVHGA